MKKIFLLSAVLTLVFTSCDKGDEVGTFGANNTIVGFPDNFSKSFFTNVSTGELLVPTTLVSYVNETYPSDVTINWSVDPSSTAVAGVDYDLPTSTTVTIPSGSTTANIPFTVHPNVFDPSDPKKLVLRMNTVATGNALVGEQFRLVTITLQGVCVSDIGGNYSTSTLRVNNGAIYTFANEVITPTAPGGSEYITTYVGPYYCTGQAPGSANTVNLPAGTVAGYVFTDICDTMQLATQNLAAVFSNEVRQSPAQFANSVRNPITGVMVIYYSVYFTGNTVERQFVSTYTPI